MVELICYLFAIAFKNPNSQNSKTNMYNVTLGLPPPTGPSNPSYYPGCNPSYPVGPLPAYPAYPSGPPPPYSVYPVAPAPAGFPYPIPSPCAPPGAMPYPPPGPYPVGPRGPYPVGPAVPPPGVFQGPYPHCPKWGHHKHHHRGFHHGGPRHVHMGLTGGLLAVGMGLAGHKANKKLRKKMKKAHKAHKRWHNGCKVKG